jgi:uncharacterized protein YjbI with pentapeptide repeats
MTNNNGSIDGANFFGRIPDEADFLRRSLREAEFWGYSLIGANLVCANLSKVSFTNACLRNAYLMYANLREACFRGADLTGAYLRLSYSSENYLLTNTTLMNARFDQNTYFPGGFDPSACGMIYEES